MAPAVAPGRSAPRACVATPGRPAAKGRRVCAVRQVPVVRPDHAGQLVRKDRRGPPRACLGPRVQRVHSDQLAQRGLRASRAAWAAPGPRVQLVRRARLGQQATLARVARPVPVRRGPPARPGRPDHQVGHQGQLALPGPRGLVAAPRGRPDLPGQLDHLGAVPRGQPARAVLPESRATRARRERPAAVGQLAHAVRPATRARPERRAGPGPVAPREQATRAHGDPRVRPARPAAVGQRVAGTPALVVRPGRPGPPAPRARQVAR